jgi:NTP pyrophosphatase (non-canonical NTP hydrolase)
MKVNDHALWMKENCAVYPDAGTGTDREMMYLGLGLGGEAGEVLEKIKKAYRDGQFDNDALAKEIGDVYWYLGQLCLFIGTTPSEVLQLNKDKLASRLERNVLKGSGDDR